MRGQTLLLQPLPHLQFRNTIPCVEVKGALTPSQGSRGFFSGSTPTQRSRWNFRRAATIGRAAYSLPWQDSSSRIAGSGGCRVSDVMRGKERAIVAEVRVAAPTSVVWEILTDFEGLVGVVPNLQVSRVLPCKSPEKVIVQQVGSSCSALW